MVAPAHHMINRPFKFNSRISSHTQSSTPLPSGAQSKRLKDRTDTFSAIIGNDSKFIQTLIKAGDAAGERFWELPLWPEHMDDMKGTFADLQNIGKSGTAGTITGAAFLASFVPENIPWAHMDIAGTAWEETSKPWTDPGVTLFGARTLIEWINGL